MKGKILLICLLSGGMIGSYQVQAKQIISAEPKETGSYMKNSTENRVAVEGSSTEESTALASSSEISLEQTTDSQMKEAGSATTRSSEPEKVTEDPPSATIESEKITEAQVPLPKEKVEEHYQFSVTKNQTTQEFIQSIGKEAQTIAWNEELYASVMIAQAILETGSGNSQLGRPPYHNLFGIKGSYQGKQVRFDTQEDKGNGQLYTIKSGFRQYPSYRESLEDYAELLKQGISGNPGFYQGTWKVNALTYQDAAKALTGKYATDTAYDQKLTALIEAYNLTDYDQEPAAIAEVAEKAPVENLDQEEESLKENQSEEESSENREPELMINQTKQPVIVVPPAAQRPAKQLSGNRIVQ